MNTWGKDYDEKEEINKKYFGIETTPKKEADKQPRQAEKETDEQRKQTKEAEENKIKNKNYRTSIFQKRSRWTTTSASRLTKNLNNQTKIMEIFKYY